MAADGQEDSPDYDLSKPAAPLGRVTELVMASCFGVVGVALVALALGFLAKDSLVAPGLMIAVTGCLSFGAFFILMAYQLFLRTPSSPPAIMTRLGWTWFTGFLLSLAVGGGVIDWRAAVCPLVIAGLCLLRQRRVTRFAGKIVETFEPEHRQAAVESSPGQSQGPHLTPGPGLWVWTAIVMLLILLGLAVGIYDAVTLASARSAGELFRTGIMATIWAPFALGAVRRQGLTPAWFWTIAGTVSGVLVMVPIWHHGHEWKSPGRKVAGWAWFVLGTIFISYTFW